MERPRDVEEMDVGLGVCRCSMSLVVGDQIKGARMQTVWHIFMEQDVKI